jgi:hypothetical protein
VQIPRENWSLIFRATNEVIDRDHPDFEYLDEERRIQEWMDAGAPSDEQPSEPDAVSAPPVPVHLQVAVDKKGAGALLGGKSEDWIEKHVLPHVSTIRPSRSVLIPRDEVDRWSRENSGKALDR